MSFRGEYPLHLAVYSDEDDDRQHMSDAFHDVEPGVVVATDGHMLAVVPSGGLKSPGGFVSPTTGRPVEKGDRKDFPPYRSIVDTVVADHAARGTIDITLDPTLLAILAEAIGARVGVVLTISLPSPTGERTIDPILVRPSHIPRGEFGILMPQSPVSLGPLRAPWTAKEITDPAPSSSPDAVAGGSHLRSVRP